VRVRGDDRGLVRPHGRDRLRGRRPPPGGHQQTHPGRARRALHRELRLSQAQEADLHVGNPIIVSTDSPKELSKSAYDHLWMHFTRMSSYENAPVPTIVRGEGTHIYDEDRKRYL